LANADKVMLQYFSDSRNVGYYTAGFRIGGFIQLISGVVGLLFFPLFTKAIKENNIVFINDKINKFERFMFAFIFPVTVLVAIYSDIIVKIILGTEYLSTIPILGTITISMFFLTLFQPYGNLLLAKGKFFLSAMIFLFKFFFFLTLAFIIVNPGLLNRGGFGMAIAVFITQVLTGGAFLFFAKKSESSLKVFKSIKLVIFSVAFSLIAYYCYSLLSDNLLPKLAFGFMYFIFFWGLGYYLKMIEKNDWKMVLNIIDFDKMKNYIRKEISNK